MATHDYNLANADGATFRSDLNSALSAIVSQNSSASEPSTTFAYQFWADTTNDLLKQRNAANSGWITLYTLSTGDAASNTVPTAAIEDNAITLAKMAGGTDGELITYDASGNPATVAVGTSGQVLTSNGAGSAPTMQTVSAGADTSLSNLTATGENKVCQAWVNFDGTDTVAINDSHNVSSITDNGTGNYTVNFSTSMANANYSVSTSGGNHWAPVNTNTISTSSMVLDIYRDETNGQLDDDAVCAQVFGD